MGEENPKSNFLCTSTESQGKTDISFWWVTIFYLPTPPSEITWSFPKSVLFSYSDDDINVLLNELVLWAEIDLSVQAHVVLARDTRLVP